MEQADILANLELNVPNLKKNEDKLNAIVEALYLIIKGHTWKLIEIFADQLKTLAKGQMRDPFELHYFLLSIIKINSQRIQHELEFKFNELKIIILEKKKDSFCFLNLCQDLETSCFQQLQLKLKQETRQRYSDILHQVEHILSNNIDECNEEKQPQDPNDFYQSGYFSDTECMYREKNKCKRRFYTKKNSQSSLNRSYTVTLTQSTENASLRRYNSVTEHVKASSIFLNSSCDETDTDEMHTNESNGNSTHSHSYEAPESEDFYASKFNAASPHSPSDANEYEAAKSNYTSERRRIRLGMKVFALKEPSHNLWKMAKITRICDTLSNNPIYCVKFHDELNFEKLAIEDSIAASYKNEDDDDDDIVEYNASYIAFSEPPDASSTLRVRSRVVTLYTNENDEKAPYFSSGTVCEVPNARNHNRYLVFFDDGFAQYIDKHEAYSVFDAFTVPAENMSADQLKFLAYYFEHYPEKAMVKLEMNHVLSACFSNRWRVCRVVDLDCSLVRLHFTELNHFEWIYRGSFRLLPIYEQLRKKAELEATVNSSRTSVARQHLSNRSFNTSTFNVVSSNYKGPSDRILMGPESRQRHQYLSHHASTIFPAIRQQTARKNSAAPPKAANVSNAHLQNVTKLNQGTTKLLDLEFIIRDEVVKFVPHPCTCACVSKWEEYYVVERRYMNPLMMPLMFGWQRYHSTQSRECNKSNRKIVTYMAPCGRVLRSVSEIEKYLMQTNSQMAIDMFALDPDVLVSREFEPNPVNIVSIDDISDGRETVPITCVNCVDDTHPDTIDYSKDRQPLRGVPLDTDPSKLEGCDCTDGCRDKMKCACWLKTLEATTLIGKGEINSSAGYKGRRLHEMVSTGIFECNKNCRCDHRCTNRVVQNGISVRLQLFKTQQKGWGLRCLDDVEKGAFVCIYTGHLMTEEQSDIRGRELGDEYFAELDFIECLKKLREHCSETNDDSGSDDSSEPYANRLNHLRRPGSASLNNIAQIPHQKKVECISLISDDEDDDDYSQSGHFVTTFSHTSINRTTSEATNIAGLYPDSSLTSGRSRRSEVTRKKNDMNCLDILNNYRFFKNKRSSFYFKNFIKNQRVYIMDAKLCGNIGRYFNHSCTPNLFVQNVFVDTYDFSFPWIAFFAMHHIKAGNELCWDYNYTIDSVKGRKLYCYCKTANCRGRLL